MTRLRAYGLSVEVPAGWEARAFRHAGGDPTLHLASFALPPSDGEFGTRATGGMPEESVFVALTEYRVSPGGLRRGIFANVPPRSFPLESFGPRALLLARPGQRGVQRFFTAAARAFCAYVVLRADRRDAVLAAIAGECVASLEVESRG